MLPQQRILLTPKQRKTNLCLGTQPSPLEILSVSQSKQKQHANQPIGTDFDQQIK